jgi:D-alanine--poly(phosphoribitol) ligase subunit 1
MLNKIATQFETRPEQPAFFLDSTFHSYRQLADRVATIQAMIDSYCSSMSQIIAVVDNSDLETYASIIAILFSGHAYLPINPKNPIDRNVSILKQTDVDLVLSSKEGPAQEELAVALPHLRISKTSLLEKTSQTFHVRSVPDTYLAYLLFTSGSTGTPKGVPINRRNLTAFLEGLLEVVDLQSDDRVLQMFDLTFDFSVMSLFAPLVVGACIYPASTGELRFMSVYRLLEEQELTCAPMVPSMLTFLRPYFSDIHLDKLRFSIFCGEPLLLKIVQEWAVCCPKMRIINFYGPTEATVFCSYYEWSRDRQKSVNGALSIGKPMSKAIMSVVNDQRQILPPNRPGELCLAGDQLTTGYWRDPERNAEAFFEAAISDSPMRLYRTGDVAFVDEDGDFMCLGRLDQQVKVQGFRVELTEIEHHARVCAGVKQVVAVTNTTDAGAVEIILCLGNFQGDVKAVLEGLREILPPYMLPARIVTLPELPLNDNGKIDRPTIRRLICQ